MNLRFIDPSVVRGAVNTITATLMTYGADLGEMLGGLAALAVLCLPLLRPPGQAPQAAQAAVVLIAEMTTASPAPGG